MQYCRGRRIKGNRARKAVWLYYPTFRRIANKYTCSAAYNRAVLVSEFDFHLPEELIAQQPLADRAASRMLHLDRNSGAFQDTGFREFPNLLRPGDLLVLNNTRVLPARLFGHRGGLHAQRLSPQNPAMRDFLHGKVEVLLAKQVSLHPPTWQCLVRPGRKIRVGENLFFGEGTAYELHAEIIEHGEFGERTIQFDDVPDFFERLEKLGHVPLPPYIHRQDRTEDRDQYQTVFARNPGSVAAPTAGLHFTPEILDQIRNRGIEIAEVTLHVGLGTFQPVRNEVVEENKLHTETFEIGEEAAAKLNQAHSENRRVIAVGTTAVRTLEYAAAEDGTIQPQRGEADIFIYPGWRGPDAPNRGFRLVQAVLTNFHLPKSTLLMLVSAFAGRESVLRAYDHAVAERYRFFSYGDCMFIE
ncbi:MAG: tRNA preQ1(34) S-adenosylmethionine ribosyltransferase-isomerase QueA [Terriglobia bacterium]|nr:tRNA preQ1(34) S-adenosylmethionine ribosyltransferase-isomerase QueA [Terriglobia bacterium]